MILSFSSFEERDRFITEISRQRPDVGQLVERTSSLPHLLADRLDPEQAAWLRQQTEQGRTFEELAFETFRGAA